MRIDLCQALRDPLLLAKALDADLQRGCGSVKGIATHSGEVQPGDLFVAMQGAHRSGSAFAAEAFHRGAVGILTDRAVEIPERCSIFRAKDPAKALMHGAAFYRRVGKSFLVAVSGSTGKTTAKEAIASVLREKGSVCMSLGNYNSTVGFPLSVLSFSPGDFWVVELGINHVGEMEPMSMAAKPDLAVLTNVGHAHIGHFKNWETLLSEKAKIVKYLNGGGRALLPIELPRQAFPCEPERILTFGKGGDFDLEKIDTNPNGICGELKTPQRVITNLTWSVPGRVGRATLLAVAAACSLMGVEDAALRRGLRQAAVATPRLRTVCVGERLLIDDCYNASPEAMEGALEVLRYRAAGRPAVAVLGSMLELGEQSAVLHRGVGRAVAKGGVGMLFTYGAAAAEIARGAREGGMPSQRIASFGEEEREMLISALCKKLPTDAVTLFKASAKMKLGEIVKALEERG